MIIKVTEKDLRSYDPDGLLTNAIADHVLAAEQDASADYPCGHGSGTVVRRETEIVLTPSQIIMDYTGVWDELGADDKEFTAVESIYDWAQLGLDGCVPVRLTLNDAESDLETGVLFYDVSEDN